MKKLLVSLLFISLVNTVFAQYEYNSVGRNDAQTKGIQWGLVGGGFTAMLNNRDDINADQRLDPQAMNFSYGGGAEFVYWFQNNIGFGGQINYWKAGAAYKGLDTLNSFGYDLSLDAKTTLSYVKVPILFHFKSYNRYYPNRKFRFNGYFGPYVALLLNSSDNLRIYNDSAKYTETATFSGRNMESQGNFGGTPSGVQKSKVTGDVYNKFDVGFVFALGGEYRISKRAIIALHIRTDVGIANVENQKAMKIENADANGNYPVNNPNIHDFSYWNGNYAKYNAPNALDALSGWQANRPATKNFSTGIFLSVRKYF